MRNDGEAGGGARRALRGQDRPRRWNTSTTSSTTFYPAVPHHNWPKPARRLDPYFNAAGVRAVVLGSDDGRPWQGGHPA